MCAENVSDGDVSGAAFLTKETRRFRRATGTATRLIDKLAGEEKCARFTHSRLNGVLPSAKSEVYLRVR
jgi:hypothetical protein